ncbi:hypothetical protein Desde_2683 [Desulfitobacterium dehalogenans ATCC 51507]|uniref:Uncharacterized protein n=1 Tax=Desulfitobacterium dehalogenans (strain ATCC 51507 / DSM 9161 / JW/IU-DC1) TaxID=756499 RepID=I4AAL2_DESDJ|nr:hypothetical protein [Desulfitobacterium dehalogenans]AFM00997.1 hypothetical protein Desde_2683 [Desulfitobacterium dehalogenans ATCC 51507]
MKKVVLCIILFFVFLLIPSCQSNKSVGEKTIEGFLLELYQVDNTEDYQELKEKLSRYLQEISNSMPRQIGMQTMDPEDFAELFKPYSAKFKKYCTEDVLQELFRTRYIIKYDQLAWEEECQFYVRDIQITKDQGAQYSYTIEIEKRLKDGSTQAKNGEGIVQLDEEGYVNRFIITKRVDF